MLSDGSRLAGLQALLHAGGPARAELGGGEVLSPARGSWRCAREGGRLPRRRVAAGRGAARPRRGARLHARPRPRRRDQQRRPDAAEPGTTPAPPGARRRAGVSSSRARSSRRASASRHCSAAAARPSSPRCRRGCCLPLPDGVGWAEAGGFVEAFATAHDALFTQAQLALGERVLVTRCGRRRRQRGRPARARGRRARRRDGAQRGAARRGRGARRRGLRAGRGRRRRST